MGAMAAPEGRPKIIFATSPNNPDGGVVSDADLERLLALGALVVLDDAYIEFCDAPSRSAWVREHPNLIVLRTFSKMAGLAGLRVGYGIFPLDLAEYMWRAKQPYNVSVAAETAACAALENMGYLEDVNRRFCGSSAGSRRSSKAFPSSKRSLRTQTSCSAGSWGLRRCQGQGGPRRAGHHGEALRQGAAPGLRAHLRRQAQADGRPHGRPPQLATLKQHPKTTAGSRKACRPTTSALFIEKKCTNIFARGDA